LPLEITCVNKTNRPKAFESITRVGGIQGGLRWSKGVSQIIQLIEFGLETFYMQRGNRNIPVTIATNEMGYKYIQAVILGSDTNLLLGLPECIL
jgi:Protein of unknown function (DUF3892)